MSQVGINLLDVFTLNRLFAPEQAVFIGFGKGQRQHFVAAFLPDLLRQFLIVVATSKIASAISGEVLRKLAHSPTRCAFAS